jgi:hypothetical protein
MTSESGQASVEWVALLLLVTVALGAILTRAREVSGRPLGDELARRITATPDRSTPDRSTPDRSTTDRFSSRPAAIAPPPSLPGRPLGGGPRELFRAGARRFVAFNGLACYIRQSTAPGDANRIGDDIGDAIDCLNPVGGWTGSVGGTDDR